MGKDRAGVKHNRRQNPLNRMEIPCRIRMDHPGELV